VEASEVNVRIENDELGSYFILFYFFSFYFFSFYFLLSYNKTKKTKCDTITGHMSWSQEVTQSCNVEKGIEGSETR